MRPNILLFMPDQLRADWIGPANHGGARTPNVDALMARGVTFPNTVCPSPICGPSRACLATGYEYDRCTVPNNRYSVGVKEPNFYRQLQTAGYQVLTCGKLDLLKGELDWGSDGQHWVNGRSRLLELGFTGGLDSGGKHAVIFAHRAQRDEPYLNFLRSRGLADAHVADFAKRRNPALGPGAEHPGAGPNFFNADPSPLPDDAYQDDWIGDCGLDLVRQAGERPSPWFLQVNFAGPHEPMNVTAAMAESVAERDPPLPAGLDPAEAGAHRAIRRGYTAMVERLDAILGRFIAVLAETGQLDNTVIIFTSDHGEMLGDCGLWEKFVPHQASVLVPMIFAGPGVAQGLSQGPATFLDIHATALELAGAEPIAGTDSRSLCPSLADPDVCGRDVVFSGLGQWRIAFDGSCKVVAGFDPQAARAAMENATFDPQASWRLVDPQVDPCETGDLAGSRPERAQHLLAQLQQNAARTRSDRGSNGPQRDAADVEA